jgi:FlaG/FlaF family flagellin (archaellin)
MNYKKNDAVSEVVGVLLMLTVTIILVSLVAVVMNGTIDETETPITANIVGSYDNGNIIMENIAGDSFSLNQIEVRLGIREDPTKYAILRNGESTYLVSFTGDNIIALGDRFKIVGTQEADGISWGSFNVSKGDHLTYRFYDASGKPISSGEIMIPYV